jgi:hypothetical protein
MSTDGTFQPDPTTPPTGATVPPTPENPLASTSEGTLANVAPTEQEPSFFTRHTTTLITLMFAVIVAAIAIAGVAVYRHNVDQTNSNTEAAFAKTVAASQGATLETVECHGDTCAAIVSGQAYTVLVQKDSKGKQHFGVSAYAGH